MLNARYKYKPPTPPAAGPRLHVWRALCSYPRCPHQLAQLAAFEPDYRIGVFFVSLPLDFARNAQGWWRQSARLPRRPFRSGADGSRSVGDGVPAHGVPHSKRFTITDRDTQTTPLVIVCPRCGVPSEVRLEDFRAAIREQLERLINRLKQFRRVATRYEKLADQYLGMVTLAAILLWLG